MFVGHFGKISFKASKRGVPDNAGEVTWKATSRSMKGDRRAAGRPKKSPGGPTGPVSFYGTVGGKRRILREDRALRGDYDEEWVGGGQYLWGAVLRELGGHFPSFQHQRRKVSRGKIIS